MTTIEPRPVLRRCVSCRELHDRRHLWRLIRQAGDGSVTLDSGMGRSAYVCRRSACLDEARRRRRLQRALRVPVPDAILDLLVERLSLEGDPPLRQDEYRPVQMTGTEALRAPSIGDLHDERRQSPDL
jgi:hypothetical protein